MFAEKLPNETNKQYKHIADLLNRSPLNPEIHRQHLRRQAGLHNTLLSKKNVTIRGVYSHNFVSPLSTKPRGRFSFWGEILSLARQEVISCLVSLGISKFRENLPSLPDGLARLRILISSPGAHCPALAEGAKGGYIQLGESSSFCNI